MATLIESNMLKDAPLWMQHTAAALIILFASKGFLIDSIPMLETAVKTNIALWFDYIVNVMSVLFSIMMIFSKKSAV